MLHLYQNIWRQLLACGMPHEQCEVLRACTEKKLAKPIQGDFPKWLNAYENLPAIHNVITDFSSNSIKCNSQDIHQSQEKQLHDALRQLMPWRKGPFELFATFIDSEWQSQLKWNRIKDKIPALGNKRVLDVGCGNGYYMFRMRQQKPSLLIGIDPGILQIMQFWAVEKYAQSQSGVLPLSAEDLPQKLEFFDIVLSMGVLYHRKSPLQHIRQLADTLKTKGTLIIETLIVDGDESTCLFPQNRYAQMRNVWFLPSVKMLGLMLQRNGFTNIKCIDQTTTTTQEQRSTDWMRFHSLKNFLNAEQSLTIEGYPLPKRATLIAEKK